MWWKRCKHDWKVRIEHNYKGYLDTVTGRMLAEKLPITDLFYICKNCADIKTKSVKGTYLQPSDFENIEAYIGK